MGKAVDISIFDIIGPIMIGPSSSHTAGAARIGGMAKDLLGHTPKEVVISLYGSFAATYKGHATDKALVGGLLGFAPDDPRIRDSLRLAREHGMAFHFDIHDTDTEAVNSAESMLGQSTSFHPNTAIIEAVAADGILMRIKGASIGGGIVRVEVLT